MALAFQSAGAIDSCADSSDTTIVCPIPSGTASGDLLVAVFARNGNTRNPSATGWSTLHTSNTRLCALYRQADGTEGSNVTFTFALTFAAGSGCILRFTGHDTTPTFATGTETLRSSNDTTVDLPEVTVPSNGGSVIWIGGHGTASRTFDSCSRGSATERADGRSGTYAYLLGVYTEDSLAAGGTGTATFTLNSNTSSKHGWAIAINQASSGTKIPRFRHHYRHNIGM